MKNRSCFKHDIRKFDHETFHAFTMEKHLGKTWGKLGGFKSFEGSRCVFFFSDTDPASSWDPMSSVAVSSWGLPPNHHPLEEYIFPNNNHPALGVTPMTIWKPPYEMMTGFLSSDPPSSLTGSLWSVVRFNRQVLGFEVKRSQMLCLWKNNVSSRCTHGMSIPNRPYFARGWDHQPENSGLDFNIQKCGMPHTVWVFYPTMVLSSSLWNLWISL